MPKDGWGIGVEKVNFLNQILFNECFSYKIRKKLLLEVKKKKDFNLSFSIAQIFTICLVF